VISTLGGELTCGEGNDEDTIVDFTFNAEVMRGTSLDSKLAKDATLLAVDNTFSVELGRM